MMIVSTLAGCALDGCGETFPPGNRRRYCSRAHTERANAQRSWSRRKVVLAVPGETAICPGCGVEFTSSYVATHSDGVRYPRRLKWCTGECRQRITWERRRLQKLGAWVEDVSTPEIAERDGWTCQRCLSPVDWNGTGSALPTLDHVIPLSLGGTHERANVQLMHLGCNQSKCNRITLTDVRRRLQLEMIYA